jgi:hypothetical protein
VRGSTRRGPGRAGRSSFLTGVRPGQRLSRVWREPGYFRDASHGFLGPRGVSEPRLVLCARAECRCRPVMVSVCSMARAAASAWAASSGTVVVAVTLD